MALPQDGQNANALATVKEVPTGKKLIFVDPTTNEGGVITLEDLTTQILKNLTSQTFALDQGTKTLPAALNELNSNRLFDIYRNYSWKTSHSIDVSKANTLLMIAFGGSNGDQSIVLPLTKTGTDTWLYNAEYLATTNFAISCKSNVLTITNTATFLCFLVKVI